jgi:hypothetical protein
VDIAIGPRDVEVAADNERTVRGRELRGEGAHRLEEAHLGGEVLAAVRHVDRCDGQRSEIAGDDAMLVIEWPGCAKVGRVGAIDLLTCRATPE